MEDFVWHMNCTTEYDFAKYEVLAWINLDTSRRVAANFFGL